MTSNAVRGCFQFSVLHSAFFFVVTLTLPSPIKGEGDGARFALSDSHSVSFNRHSAICILHSSLCILILSFALRPLPKADPSSLSLLKDDNRGEVPALTGVRCAASGATPVFSFALRPHHFSFCTLQFAL
jgi:hypothetical protein